ncbi:hypothetical protein D3C75_991770 [compost metagenome]
MAVFGVVAVEALHKMQGVAVLALLGEVNLIDGPVGVFIPIVIIQQILGFFRGIELAQHPAVIQQLHTIAGICIHLQGIHDQLRNSVFVDINQVECLAASFLQHIRVRFVRIRQGNIVSGVGLAHK